MDSHNQEIHKAFERLQRTIGQVADRTRGLQRERKLLLERIDELEGTCITLDAAVGERSNEVLKERERYAELEEQILQMQSHQQVLQDKIAGLSTELKEREEFIVGQEDGLLKAHDRIKELEAGRSASGELETVIASLREELEAERANLVTQDEEWEKKNAALEHDQGEQLSELREELERERKRFEEREREWEHRIAEAENSRDEMREHVETLIRERDQARATVESMLVRVRQLESEDDEQSLHLQKKVEDLTQDLEEALEMASTKEAEAEELQARFSNLEETLNGSNGTIVLKEEVQAELVSQVEAALTLIDKHLGENVEQV